MSVQSNEASNAVQNYAFAVGVATYCASIATLTRVCAFRGDVADVKGREVVFSEQVLNTVVLNTVLVVLVSICRYLSVSVNCCQYLSLFVLQGVLVEPTVQKQMQMGPNPNAPSLVAQPLRHSGFGCFCEASICSEFPDAKFTFAFAKSRRENITVVEYLTARKNALAKWVELRKEREDAVGICAVCDLQNFELAANALCAFQVFSSFTAS